MTDRASPARPHHRLTPDGRRVREVLTYTRRGNRLSDAQARVWDRCAPDWLVPEESLDEPGFEVSACFGRDAPLVVEIGSGVGEATAELAAARPWCNVLAVEVWRPGVADTFRRLEQREVDNVRVLPVDAVWLFEHRLRTGDVAELWTFFPDPWPKKRHHKRRLVTPGFAGVAADRLAPAGTWRLATDWSDYADGMREALGAEPRLSGGVVPRWSERPVTKFERKGMAAGRRITDLSYVRV